MTDDSPLPTMVTLSAFNKLVGIRHGFFTAEGGVSLGVYASLNCSYAVGDDPNAVDRNRARAMEQFDLPLSALASLQQCHSNIVRHVDESWDTGLRPDADALVTNRRGLALGILGADCPPVLFCDSQAGVIGAAHAGWRGAVGGVLENTIAAMEQLGADRVRIVAAVGPGIGPRSYEVGLDFSAPFLRQDPENMVFFRPGADPEHVMFDLPGYIVRRLTIQSVAVARSPCDTFREDSRFFSHRRSSLRGEGRCGRNLSVILLES